MNSISIMGRLTKEPTVRKTQNGKTALQMCVAVDRGDKNKTADYIDCQAWEGTAEFISKYFHKGSPIAITGRLQTRIWEKEDGSKQKIAEVLVTEVSFMPRGTGSGEGGDNVSF